MADHTSPPTPFTPEQLQVLADAKRAAEAADEASRAGGHAWHLDMASSAAWDTFHELVDQHACEMVDQLLTTQQRLAEAQAKIDELEDRLQDALYSAMGDDL